jgi:TrmH family RNA methyltransferase
MAAELISSRRNPLVAQVRALHQGRGRRDQGLLLLEGNHLWQECQRLNLLPKLLIATPRWLGSQPWLDPALPLQPVTPEVLAAMATTETPDGVIALLACPGAGQGPEPVLAPGAEFVLALDRVQDPGNLGTLMRTALAAGVDQLWLGGGADPWQPKVLRSSAGAALELQGQRLESLGPAMALAAAQGFQLLAAVGQGGRPYWELDWCQPTLLLAGNEGAGIDPELLGPGVIPVTIPHGSQVESLNVGVAAGVLLLERWRQRLSPAGGRGESPTTELGR